MKYCLPTFLFFTLCCLRLSAQETCDGNLGPNIFEEGDFGAGLANILPTDPGIAPGYNYTTLPPPNDGSYTIANSTASWNLFPGWMPVEDNGPEPNGYMMVVNASYDEGIFYEQVVDGLCEGTLYEFSADVLNLIDPTQSGFIFPDVSFLIDDEIRYTSGDVPQNGQWNTYGFTFTTDPGQTTVKLTLRNNAPGGFGNDLALDNISFRACGDEALILPEEIANICEDGNPITLEATILGEQFDTPTLQWQRSPDGQTNWEDIPGATSGSIQHTELSGGFYYYRYLLANSSANLDNPRCYIISNVKVVYVQPKFFEITDTVCAGSTYAFDGKALSETGVYIDSLTSSIGCDSIVTLRLTRISDPGIQAQIAISPTRCPDTEDGQISVSTLQNAYLPATIALNGEAMAPPAVFAGLPPGDYPLRIVDRHGCQLLDTLTVNTPPPLLVELGPDQAVALGESLNLSATVNESVSSWAWQPEDAVDCLDPDCLEVSLLPATSFTLRLNGQGGDDCTASDSLRISVEEVRRVYLPTAFSPNDDGRNDRFQAYVQRPNVQALPLFQVYDRWGSLVFEAENLLQQPYMPQWDGTVAGEPAPVGAYTYILEAVFLDGRAIRYAGSVMLIR